MSALSAEFLPPHDGRPRIGISWASIPESIAASNKTMSLQLLLDALGPGPMIVSLQKDIPETGRPALEQAGHGAGQFR